MELGRKTVYVATERLLGAGVRVAILLALARTTGAEAVGLFAIGLAAITLTGGVTNLGFHLSAVHFAAQQPHARVPRRLTLVLPAVSGLVGGAVVGGVLYVISDLVTAQAAVLIAMATGVNNIKLTGSNLLLGRGLYPSRLVAEVCQYAALGLLFAALAVWTDLGGAHALLAWLVGLCAGAIAVRVMESRFNGRPLAAAGFSAWLRFGRPVIVYQVGVSLAARGDLLALAVVAPARQVGYYSIARQAIDAVMYLPNMLAPVFLEEESGASGNADRRRRVGLLASLPFLVAAPVYFFLVSPVFGGEFEPAALPGAVLLLGGAAYAQIVLDSHVAMAHNDGRLVATHMLAVGFVLTLAAPVVFPVGGLPGVAAGAALVYAAAAVSLRSRLGQVVVVSGGGRS